MAGTARNALNGIAPWFGAKRTMASRIVEELGPHRSYWEPFCGSCAVLLAKPVVAHETVNDLHADLINLAMVLASDRWTDARERVCRTLCHEDLYAHHRDVIVSETVEPAGSPAAVADEHVERAVSYLVVVWMGMNGMAGCVKGRGTYSVRWTPTGGRGGWARVAESIEAWHERLRHVSILRRDAFEVLDHIADQDGVVLYVDPPYYGPCGARYRHRFGDDDHERLATALHRFTHARIVLSYYEHPEIRRLYDGWTVVEVGGRKSLAHAARPGKRAGDDAAPEILLLNGPSLAEPKTLFKGEAHG